MALWHKNTHLKVFENMQRLMHRKTFWSHLAFTVEVSTGEMLSQHSEL